jgi:hypothetical protein
LTEFAAPIAVLSKSGHAVGLFPACGGGRFVADHVFMSRN